MGDVISVQWLLHDELVWWSAVVTDIKAGSCSDSARHGELQYRPFRDYGAETMPVVFIYLQSTSSRFISHNKKALNYNKADDNIDHCSWVFEHEMSHGDIGCNRTDIQPVETSISADDSTIHHEQGLSTPSRSPSARRTKASHIARQRPLLSTPPPQLHTLRNKIAHGVNQVAGITIDNEPDRVDEIMPAANSNVTEHEYGVDQQHKLLAIPRPTLLDHAVQVNVDDPQDVKVESTGHRHSSANNGFPYETQKLHHTGIPPSVQIRLENLERRLADVDKSATSSNPSPSMNSVKVMLKWALLRQLEKPLKDLKLSDLSQLGVGRSSYIVSAQCDYVTFMEITSSLARVHKCFQTSQRTGRIAFTPSFDIIQSGSCASDNLTVIFSSLSDLAAFLNIRDDKDYESMVVKETIGEERSILRLLGTYLVEETTSASPPKESTKHVAVKEDDGDSSVCCDSNDSNVAREKYLRLYVASAPVAVVQDVPRGSPQNRPDTKYNSLRTVVIEQRCAYFSKVANTFQTPWRVRRGTSDFKVACNFDLDGEVREENLQTYFTLSWSRLQHPSCKKWTRDVHNIGDNCPGNLTLSVPFIFISANRNVKALSNILDTTIEYFMTLRSRMARV